MTGERQPPLWQQLQQVAGVLQSIRRGQSGTAAINAVPASVRPGIQALSFEVLRSLGRAQALRQQLAPRNPPAAVDALLCVALALLWEADNASYDPFTLVNQSVEAAKKMPGTRSQAAFINACLRRFLREHNALLALTDQNPAARWNHPQWWIEQLQADWPVHWEAILAAADQPGPMVLRVNVRRTTQAEYLLRLQAAGLASRPIGPCGILLAEPCAVGQLPGFADGWVSVQDSAAQMAAPLLLAGMRDKPALRVLDACAAPGGKTAHMLELADATVVALDLDALRCDRIHQNLARLDLDAEVVVADAADVSAWWDGEPFDAILLDAPCSASGIVRRHPDIRWLRRPTDLPQLTAIQSRLLTRLWPLLKPGGRLLYCTCSVFRAEGERQISAFLARTTQAALLDCPGHLLPVAGSKSVDNQSDDHDGFYYALLERRAP